MKKHLTVALCLMTAMLLLTTLSGCSKKAEEIKKNHVHVWGEWQTVKNSTCSEEGEAKRTCACGDSQVHPITTLAHTIDSKESKPATCISEGYVTYTCQCGHSYQSAKTPKGDHSVSEWTVIKKETCTEDGERTGTCTVCSNSVTETVSATGHQYTYEIISATETEQGYTTFTCDLCGDTYNDHFTDPIGQPPQE